MGAFYRKLTEKARDPKLGMEVYLPDGKLRGGIMNADVYDCFKLEKATAIADRIVGEGVSIREWGGRREKLFFAVKSEQVDRRRARAGFQIDSYAFSDELREFVEEHLVPVVNRSLKIQGTCVGEQKARYYLWEFSDGNVDIEAILAVIDALVEALGKIEVE